MSILLIDNYDSFTFNLMHLIGMQGVEVNVVRNDAMTVDDIIAMKPEAIVISPGPCTPDEAGISLELISKAGAQIPILGVCLGHQAIGQAYGGKIVRTTPLHGKTDLIEHNGRGLFHGLNRAIWATRYHSLTVEGETLPAELEVTARARDGVIMAFSHKEHCVHGVQFHPESIATEQGALLISNFLKLARRENFISVQGAPSQTGMKPYLAKVVQGDSLTQSETGAAFDLIMDGEATPAQIGAFLTALRLRGETPDELAGAVASVRARCKPVRAPDNAMDIVGTGGDASHSLNISTATALVVAACGVPVAKHGNRSVSSRSGAADVLEALGLNLEPTLDAVETSLKNNNFAFLFAPRHHEAIARVVPVRRELGVPTLFNLLGPLVNPANVKYALMGVNAPRWLEPFADVFGRLGGTKAWIVHGDDGFDEISLSGPTQVVEWDNGRIRKFSLTPEDAGVARHNTGALKGGDAKTNANALLEMLQGKAGAYRNAVALNAAAALMIAGKAKDLREGAMLALDAIDSASALRNFEKIIQGHT